MALRFVKTEILSSSDGISHGESKALETEEVLQAKRQQQATGGKTLFEQLQVQKDKQQEAYDANTKLIFAPPRSLDAEDVEFFAAEEKKRRLAAERRDRDEIDAFAAAQAHFDSNAKQPALDLTYSASHKTSRRRQTTTDDMAPALKLRRKPVKRTKVDDATTEAHQSSTLPADLLVASPAPALTTAQNATPSSSLSAVVGCYDDDD